MIKKKPIFWSKAKIELKKKRQKIRKNNRLILFRLSLYKI